MTGMNKGDVGLREEGMERSIIRQRKNRSTFFKRKNDIYDRLSSLSRYQPMISIPFQVISVYQGLLERTTQFYTNPIGTLYRWGPIMNLAKRFRFILMIERCILLILRQESYSAPMKFRKKRESLFKIAHTPGIVQKEFQPINKVQHLNLKTVH